jgi:hypothetical protein
MRIVVCGDFLDSRRRKFDFLGLAPRVCGGLGRRRREVDAQRVDRRSLSKICSISVSSSGAAIRRTTRIVLSWSASSQHMEIFGSCDRYIARSF